ncbi:MAG: hypothetical protein NC336_09225, partial [Clostridium sp.]|nr:hypothetical protein [Clostridium sp.]
FEVMRDRAHGCLHLIQTPKGHKIVRSIEGRDPSTVVASVEVADRFKAELDFRRMFARRRSAESMNHYSLRQSDIASFESYTNRFDMAESDLCRKLLAGHIRGNANFSNL